MKFSSTVVVYVQLMSARESASTPRQRSAASAARRKSGRGRCQARSRATQIMAGTATMVVTSTVSFATVRPVW